jgi:hypothetical protein
VPEEIALFIDFENIRYSLLNIQRREPDPQELIGLARRYGTVMVARAYADWSRQPEQFKGSLMAAMIDRVDCPAKQRERVRPNWSSGYASSAWSNGPVAGMVPEGVGGNGSTPSGDETPTVFASEDELGTAEPLPSGPSGGELSARAAAAMAPPANPVVQSTIIQSTVDLNMLMDIIETVFDRPSISTFVLMTGDKDFTRISARLKLRLNKRVIVVGIPGTVSRDLVSSATEFVPLVPGIAGVPTTMGAAIEPTDPQFLQFLDYIDRNWSWRTIIGVSNFIGDPLNPKNRFRGRLTRETARELLTNCIQQGVLFHQMDASGCESLRLNRQHPAVEEALRQFLR